MPILHSPIDVLDYSEDEAARLMILVNSEQAKFMTYLVNPLAKLASDRLISVGFKDVGIGDFGRKRLFVIDRTYGPIREVWTHDNEAHVLAWYLESVQAAYEMFGYDETLNGADRFTYTDVCGYRSERHEHDLWTVERGPCPETML